MTRKTIFILSCMTIFLAGYVISTCFWDYGYVSTIAATIIAALGIFGVWFQLKKESDIKEAEFLMNYNFTFLTTEKFVQMEHRLENAMNHATPLNLSENDRQDLTDYLVYLESLAPLVLNKMIRLEVVDDLFGYRYFIAVNNPEVQEEELCKDGQYYRGCFSLYRVWKDYRKTKDLPIPMMENSLDKQPAFEKYARKKRWL